MQQIIAQRDGHVIDAQKETNQLQAVIHELTQERDLLRQDIEKLQANDADHRKNSDK